jgi:hypothetical protein
MRARLPRWVVFALGALALSSCGSGTMEKQTGSDTSRATTAPTKSSGGRTPTTTDSGQTETGVGGGNGGGGTSTSNQVTIGPVFLQGPIEFGPVQVGRSRALELTVKNRSAVARTIVGITISGENASEFVVIGGKCAVGTGLAAFGTCTLEVTFTPTASGVRSAGLAISVDPSAPGGRALRGGTTRLIQPGGPPVETQTVKTG